MWVIEKNGRRLPVDGIIFDVDGVLIDVRESYFRTTLETLEYLLRKKSFTGEFPFTIEDVLTFKGISGYNIEWDIVADMLYLVEIEAKRQGTRNLDEMDIEITPELIKDIKGSGSITDDVKDVFNELYLGAELFKKLYGKEPIFSEHRGNMYNEKPLVDPETLKKLHGKGLKLGIFTGRPEPEAEIVMEQLKISELVPKSHRVTGVAKPAPQRFYILTLKMDLKAPVYVGDNIDDYLTVESLNIPFIAVNMDGFKSEYGISLSGVDELIEAIRWLEE